MAEIEEQGRKNRINAYFVLFLVFLTAGSAFPMETKENTAAANWRISYWPIVMKKDTTASENLPFVVPNIKRIKFPRKTFLITKYGAVSDGHTKNTEAFSAAIRACSRAGGGTVIVPAGLWLTGPIRLKSNVELHTEKGAVVQFSGDFEDYPILRRTAGGRPEVRCTPPIYGENLKNIGITGFGIFDGSGQSWRPVKKSKLTESQWQRLIASKGVVGKEETWYPSKEAMNGRDIVAALDARGADVNEYAAARQYLRPVLLGLVNCKNVLIDGPTFQNSPDWNIHPLLCENLIIRNINVRNPWYSQNGDGLDPESCKNVIITNCRFDVGDDAICMKSGRDEYGRKRGAPTENVAIWDCIVYHGHGGFVIGSEMSGDIRNVYVRNCDFMGTDTGLRFKSTRGRGGVVENVFIKDIFMKDIAGNAVIFDLFYAGRRGIDDETAEEEIPEANEGTPAFRDIHFKNIICNGAGGAMLIQGLPEMPTQKLYFEDVVISAKSGVTCFEANDVSFKNVRIIPEKGPVFTLNNSRNFIFENTTVPYSSEVFLKMDGEKTAAINLRGVNKSVINKKIQAGKDVKPDAIILK